LCALGLAGPVYALIRQPSVGWGSPEVLVAMLAGLALLAAFLVHESRTPYPMLPLGLFRRRNFAFGNIETLAMYGGLSAVLFFLVLFLQQVAGYDALQAGLATLPTTIVMFSLSRYAGRLADRYGPRWFMGFGPLVAAAGLMMLQRVDAHFDYFTDLFPALLIFSLGLAATVAPLTATVLADADESDAGIASAVNNAIARTAGLLATAAVGAVLASSYAAQLDDAAAARPLAPAAEARLAAARDRALSPVDVRGLPPDDRAVVARAVQDAGVKTFHLSALIGAAMLAGAGVLGGVLLRNPRRPTAARCCAGGQFVGAPEEAGRERPSTAPATA
jgi:predicted MFS family arabinose efflux permease